MKYTLDRMLERLQDQEVQARVSRSLEEWYNSEEPDCSPEDDIMEIFARLGILPSNMLTYLADPQELGVNHWDINSPTASYNQSGPDEEENEEDEGGKEDDTNLIEAQLEMQEFKAEVIA